MRRADRLFDIIQILRRRKAGFHVPITRWIKSDLREMVGDCLAPSQIARQGFFDPGVVQEMLQAHWRGRRDHSRNIWNLLMFKLWHKKWMDDV